MPEPAICEFLLDPATGTGSFIANILRRISGVHLEHKYRNDLFANEIMLLPYYIASLNIEHTYYERTGQYLPFEGLCFADTLDMEGQQMVLFTERNTERVQAEKAAQIMVVIGNPPYNVGQENENDNNKNRKYPVIDGRIGATYAKDSQATLRNKLYDAYVKFFRWATDRLQGRDGIICYVSNNSFVDQIAFDGMRKHLLQDFTRVYHLDLHGNVRKNPKLSGTTHNVFGIQVGVGITIAIRSSAHAERALYYYRVPENWRREEKLTYLAEKQSASNIDWQTLQPDERYTWLTEKLRPEFGEFLPLGTKNSKASDDYNAEAIFKLFSLGVVTNRDSHVYSFDRAQLVRQVETFTEIYNATVDTLKRRNGAVTPDSLIDTSDQRIKWTRQVKASLARFQYSTFAPTHIRESLYRPFTRKRLYFDAFWNEEPYRQQAIFPTLATERENVAIWIKTGSEWPMFALATNVIPTLLPQGGAQTFPLYTYDEDGSNRRDNITDWALARFRAAYGEHVTKADIFAYVYAILHHPAYRERYAENLKRELPRIPLVEGQAAFAACVEIGRELARLHLEYDLTPGPSPTGRGEDTGRRDAGDTAAEGTGRRDASGTEPGLAAGLQPANPQSSIPSATVASVSLAAPLSAHREGQGVRTGVPEYPLHYRETPGAAPDWTVKKMRLSPDKTALVYNDWLTLEGIPPAAFAYRLGNRSALEWVIDQYQVSTDARSGITSDPNRRDEPRYIVRLIARVLTVSVATVRLVERLAGEVALPIPAEVAVAAAPEATS